MSQGISPLPKDNGPAADPVKVVSNKRLHTDAPSSPGYPNVYVRRKVETEHSKVNPSQELKGNGRDKTKEQEEQQNVQHNQANKPEVASPIVESGGLVPSELSSPIAESGGLVPSELSSPIAESGGLVPSESPEKISAETVRCFQRPETVSEKDKPPTTSGHGAPIASGHEPPIASGDEPPIASGNEPPIASSNEPPIASPTTSGHGAPIASGHEPPIASSHEPPIASDNEPPSASGTTVQGDSQRSSSQNQYWNERYNRLQTYLENCDRSTQEGYMRMLRSMSAADRSMHAIELEKRAIHLLVEEGKELQLMKALNVLGKVSPNGPPKQAPLQRQYQK